METTFTYVCVATGKRNLYSSLETSVEHLNIVDTATVQVRLIKVHSK